MMELSLADYKKRIICNKGKKKNIVKSILINCSYEEILKYYNATPIAIKGIFRHELQSLKCKSYGDIYSMSGLYLKDPIDFVGLLAFVLPLFSQELNDYVAIRRKFEKRYLLANYAECKNLLKQSNDISYSAWAAINEIKLAELDGGLSKRMDVYRRIVTENKILRLLQYVLDQAQETASTEASQLPFNEKRYYGIQHSHTEEWQRDYMMGMVLPFYETKAGRWMSFNMKASIIDVYNTLRDNLHLIVSSCKGDTRFLHYMQIIATHINDDRLNKFYELLSRNYKTDNGRKELLLQNTLTDEFHDYCYFAPHDMDMLVHYVSICAISDKAIGKESGCIFERLQYHLYKYLRKENAPLHYRKIEMICLSNHTLVPFRQMYNIIRDIDERNLKNISSRYWHYSLGYNIQDASFYDTIADRLQYLTTIFDYSTPHLEPQKELPMTVFNVLTVIPTLIDESVLTNLEHMASCGKLPLYTIGAIVSFLLDKYLSQSEYKKAVFLYVDAYLNNPGIRISINKDMIDRCMTRHVDIEMNAPLELSIFYYLINAKPAKIAINARRYLESVHVDLPSKISNYDNARVIFFLENVVDEKTLELFPIIFDDVTESIQERIDLCRKLKARTNEGKRFSNEISRLVREIAVIQNLKHVNASKIDVDINLLKKAELSNAKEMFEIYRNTPMSVVYLFDQQSLTLMFPKETTVHQNKQDDTSSDTKECVPVPYRQFLFTQYYLHVRDIFCLNNTAGLDYFLSSRIRHGTIVNQLRKDFQERKLTTRRNSEGGYDMNLFWAEKIFALQGPNLTRAIDAFKTFTEDIDRQIVFLKNQKIQVKTESYHTNLDACFDFSHSNLQDKIYQLYLKDSNQYEYSIDDVLESLWEYTESCFSDVKQQVMNTKQQMEHALNRLKNDIEHIVDPANSGLTTFKDAVTACHTQLENNIRIVANWFQRSQSMGMDFTFSDLIETAIKGINNNSDIQLTVKRSVSSQTKIKGRYLGALYTLMNNIYRGVL